jgi:OOP family OmpA-OmpF porin
MQFRLKLLPIVLLAYLGNLAPGLAQELLVFGKVVNYKTRNNIPAVLVFEKQPDASMTLVVKSKPYGYRANLLSRGIYHVRVSCPGYISEYLPLPVTEDTLKGQDSLELNISLVPFQVDELLPFTTFLFDVSSYRLKNSSIPELSRLAEILMENPGLIVRLEGHTDNAGKNRKSLRLAKKRVESIKEFLVKKGVAGPQIKTKAMGGGNPQSQSDSPEAHMANRRVEVRVISFLGPPELSPD